MIRKTLLAQSTSPLPPPLAFAKSGLPKCSKPPNTTSAPARGAKAEFDFRITNLYKDDVHVAAAFSSCGCTSVSVNQPTLKSWEEGTIHAVFNTPTFLGSRSATITVIIDKPMAAEVLLNVRGVIRSDIVFDPQH